MVAAVFRKQRMQLPLPKEESSSDRNFFLSDYFLRLFG